MDPDMITTYEQLLKRFIP